MLTAKKTFALMLLLSAVACQNRPSARLVPVAEGYAATSVNTAVFRTDALTTFADTQFVAFYNGDGVLTLGKRHVDSSEWTLRQTQFAGNVHDAHNTISIAVDCDGYLHVSFDHHGNALNYCRSIEPFSLELTERMPMIGADEENVTYPEFHRTASGKLLFAYRDGASGRGNLVLNAYDANTRTWQRLHSLLISGEDQRNAYWQMCTDSRGTLHLSWVWRETWLVETNHDMCYARSADEGRTWTRSDGTPYELPITAANAEYAWRIPQGSELINQTGMCADEDGNPFIATYWREANDSIPQYRLIWHDGRQWHAEQVSNRRTPFTLSGGGTKMIPIARPRIAAGERGVFVFFRDEERGSRVSAFYKKGMSQTAWQTIDLTDFAVDAWEPMIDTELWRSRERLNLFVQRTQQGDGERVTSLDPQMIYVLEIE